MRVVVEGQELLNVEASATTLGCSTPTVWRYAASGRLERIRYLGRTFFRATDVARLKHERRPDEGRQLDGDGDGGAGPHQEA